MAGSSNTPKKSDKAFGVTNIKSYIPLILDLEKLNYDAWRELFETHCFSFGVIGHLDGSSLPTGPDDADWKELDSIVKIWLYGTISQELLQMVLKRNTTARDVWLSVENLFRDNKEARAFMGNYPLTLMCFPEKSLSLNATTVKPPRPRRIILVRHGQSEGNVDEGAYTRVADPKIRLTEKGKREAEECGVRIRELIEKDGADDWKVYFYVSPYQRTNETLSRLGKAFQRSRITGVREEPRLREQDFGNFQDQEQMKIQKAVRVRYGRFFYRFPNGESAADVYDRITGFRETLRTDIDIGRFQPPGEQSPNMNLIIVSHGLTLRVFLMRWYKWTVEQFERLNNMQNGNMIVMERGQGGRYSLLVHHTEQQMMDFGLTREMLDDQKWQKTAKPGELNYDYLTNGPSFFTHFDDETMEDSAGGLEI